LFLWPAAVFQLVAQQTGTDQKPVEESKAKARAGDAEYPTDGKLYEGVVSGKKIAIFYSQEPFDPAKHKITRIKSNGRDRLTVDGEALVGVEEMAALKPGIPRLSALYVMFGDTRVNVPPEILHPVSFARVDTKCTGEHADTLVYVSSDAKTLAIDFRGGMNASGLPDEAATIEVADNGRVERAGSSSSGAGYASREFMAVIQDPDGRSNVRDKPQGRVIATLKNGERFIAIEDGTSDWWSVVLASGVNGFLHRSRIHPLAQEPLMKLSIDRNELFHDLKTRAWDVEGPAPGFPAKYVAAVRKAINGDAKALAQLFEKDRFEYADGLHTPEYRINWAAFHLIGDDSFARFLRGQPKKRIEEIADKFAGPGFTGPVSEPLPYMQRHFPKSYELLYPGRSDLECATGHEGYAHDQKFYEETVAGKPMTFFYSEQGFDVPKERRKYDPTVPGISQLSALRVMFGDKPVDVPAEYLRNVFSPWMQTCFIPATSCTQVSISSDAKTAVLIIADRASRLDPFHRWVTLTVTDDGTVVSRSPAKARPAKLSPPVAATLQGPGGHTDVRYADNPTSGITATVNNGERCIAIAISGSNWWRVWLASGQSGFVDKRSIRTLPEEPLLKIRYDGEFMLSHEAGELRHASELQGMDYEATANNAVAGDPGALTRLLSAGPMMDDRSIEPYLKMLWVVMHRIGDETFANSVRQQSRNATREIRQGFSDPSITAPFIDAEAYLKKDFPETNKALAHASE
jgi:hypothetical protein